MLDLIFLQFVYCGNSFGYCGGSLVTVRTVLLTVQLDLNWSGLRWPGPCGPQGWLDGIVLAAAVPRDNCIGDTGVRALWRDPGNGNHGEGDMYPALLCGAKLAACDHCIGDQALEVQLGLDWCLVTGVLWLMSWLVSCDRCRETGVKR